MPLIGTVGVSEATADKQAHFTGLVHMHMDIVQGLLKKQDWMAPWYQYLDLHAGSGRYPYQGRLLDGSPLLVVERARVRALPFRGDLIEKDLQSWQQLTHYLAEVCGPPTHQTTKPETASFALERGEIRAFQGDHHAYVPQILAGLQRQVNRPDTLYGLIYADPNGGAPPWDLLEQCANLLTRCDVLLYVSATGVKRARQPGEQSLEEHVQAIDKKHWLIREPEGKQQWTFLLGTNWTDFPAWTQRRFYGIQARIGQSILHRLSMNREAYYGHGQLSLFTA